MALRMEKRTDWNRLEDSVNWIYGMNNGRGEWLLDFFLSDYKNSSTIYLLRNVKIEIPMRYSDRAI